MSAGVRTTEFWITVATDLGIVGSALAGALPPKWAAVAAAVANVAYAISRGLAKQGTTPIPVVSVRPTVPTVPPVDQVGGGG